LTPYLVRSYLCVYVSSGYPDYTPFLVFVKFF
jgi:hypothetical protein